MTVAEANVVAEGQQISPGPDAKDLTPNQDGGVLKEIIREGTGDARPSDGCKVKVHYEGKLLDGTEFDSSREREPFEFNLGKGSVIKAWDLGVATMREGEICKLFCKADYAYGKNGSPPKIPPDATLVFEIEMIGWEAEDLSSKKDKSILRYRITPGVGVEQPNEGSTVEVSLIGEHEGRIFDERDVTFCLGEGCEEGVIPGIEKALEKFTQEEQSKLVIKPHYAFGSAGSEKYGVPGGATVTYTVTLKKFEKLKDNWMMESKEKLEQGAIYKGKGTNYFKAEKFQLALKMYKKVVDYLEYGTGFENEQDVERKALLLAAHLNIAMCYLKLQNFTSAKNQCDKALEQDSKNVKALFRRGQAYLGLNEPNLAKEDFEKVLALDPTNKAASSQIAFCQKKIKEIRGREKEIYSNMFEKYTQKKEWRYGWWDKDSPKPDVVEDNLEEMEEKKKEREAKMKFLEEQKKLIKEMKERREREAKEKKELETPSTSEGISSDVTSSVDASQTIGLPETAMLDSSLNLNESQNSKREEAKEEGSVVNIPPGLIKENHHSYSLGHGIEKTSDGEQNS